MVKNKGFWVLFIFYVVGMLADFILTFLVKNKEVFETNLAYHYIGFVGIILVNIAVVWLLWWLYYRSSATPTTRFMLIMSMVMIIAVRIYAISNAFYNIQNPVSYEVAVAISTPQAKAATINTVMQIAYPPFIMGLVGYVFWKIDHHARRKDE